MKPRRYAVIIIVASVAAVAVSPFLDPDLVILRWLSGRHAPGDPPAEIVRSLLVDFLLPRTVAGFLAGAALSLGGMVFQAVFRNPLATPYTLGVASGASLGAALFGALGLNFALLGASGVTLFAFAGAAATVLFVYLLTRIRGGFSTFTLLLAGVAVSFLFSSMILLAQFVSEPENAYALVRWIMGRISVRHWSEVAEIGVLVGIGGGVVVWRMREIDMLSAGEDLAAGMGVDVRKVKITLFFAVSLMTAAVTARFGPIGFVGMMIPHLCRLMVGSEHRILTPCAAFAGGGFLVACDTIARCVYSRSELPVGIITALLGAPFFLWLLLRRKAPVVS